MMSEELLTRSASNLELLRESGHSDEEFTEEVKVFVNHIRQLYQLNQLVAFDIENETTGTQARERLDNLNNFLSCAEQLTQRYYNFMKDDERIVRSLSGLEGLIINTKRLLVINRLYELLHSLQKMLEGGPGKEDPHLEKRLREFVYTEEEREVFNTQKDNVDQAQQILVAQEQDSEQLNMEAEDAMSKAERPGIVNLVSSETAAELANKTAQANVEAKEAPHLKKRLRDLDAEEEREITGLVNLVETAAANKMAQANVEALAKEAPPFGKRLRKSYHDLFDDDVLPPALLAP